MRYRSVLARKPRAGATCPRASIPPRTGRRSVLLYDASCGFCRWAVAQVLRWDRAVRLRPLGIQSEEGQRLLAVLDPADRLASWHLVTADGCLYSAGAAAAPLMRLLPCGRPGALVCSVSPGLTNRVYRWVARHRTGIGRFVPSGARQRAFGELERRERAGAEQPAPENVRPC
jgi:predicted DCC family thiol-disulfide oxidoreductase YuxK